MAERKKATTETAGPAADKKRALETAIAQIERTYGKGSIMRLGANEQVVVESIPTGSLALDLALGIGGVPRGRIIEIYGPESSGKTTLALHIAAEAQKRGGEVAFIDAEHALDPAYARALGVDIDNMLISQPDTGEQGLEICEALVRSGALDVIVVDSVAALTPRAEIEGEMGDSHVGLLARLMSQALRKLAGSIAKTHCVVIFINQLREKVGVMYGNPEVLLFGELIIKHLVCRMRPFAINGAIELIIKAPSGFSFPSSHTATCFAMATAIYLFHKRLGVVAYVYASLVAFSRMYLYVHYPSDIIGGIALGIGCGIGSAALVKLICKKIDKHKELKAEQKEQIQ